VDERKEEMRRLLIRLKEIEAAGPGGYANTRKYINDRLDELEGGGDKMGVIDFGGFSEKPARNVGDRRGMIFDVEIDVDYDWSADKAPNPMDEVSMLKMRIEQALREEFPNGNYKLHITECDC
jgi:hypothetical protein